MFENPLYYVLVKNKLYISKAKKVILVYDFSIAIIKNNYYLASK